MSSTSNQRKNILITGGAGFIGSNLVEALLQDSRVGLVRVLDNLSTGFKDNLEPFQGDNNFEFIEGDIRDFDLCCRAMQDINLVSHQAALGSVPRSVEDPITSNAVNVDGTLNIFRAAVESNVQRVAFASSSSVYGDSEELPKVESKIGQPLSPYAVTKYVKELYADVFAKNYPFEFIGLRYFNVFGPKQDPNGAYAAVIPLFMKAALNGKSPFINGDGSYSRDFTYIDNVVQANCLSLFTTNSAAINQIYNVACGAQTTINQLWLFIKKIAGSDVEANYRSIRAGDIPHSHANVSKAKQLLGYQPNIDIETGLKLAFDWYASRSSKWAST